MRILILTQYYPPEIGGAQTRLAAVARELSRRGHDVEIVTAMPHHLLGRVYDGYQRKLYVHEVIDGISVHRTWVYAATGTGLRRLLNYLSFSFTCLFTLMRVKRPDIVFVESPPLTLGVSGWLSAKLRGASFVFNVSDLWPDTIRDLGVMRDGPALRLAEHLEAWIYRRAKVINAVTTTIADVLLKKKNVPARKVCFLPNGIDTDLFSPRPSDDDLRLRLGLNGRPILIYAGTHGIGTGLHHVVDAGALLSEEATVLFVGAGPTKSALIERAQRLGARNIRFLDPVPLKEMPSYFSIAHAAIVPIVRSNVNLGARPSKLFPAFASGVPIIYSGDGEGARLVSEGSAGIVVPFEDPAAVAEAMRRLIADERLHAELSTNGRALAIKFSWSSIVDQWLQSVDFVGKSA